MPLSPRMHLSKLKDAQIVSLPPICTVAFSEGRSFSAASKVKEETMVRRKLFLSFPQAGSNVDFCVGSVRLSDGHKWDWNEQASGGRSWEGAALERVKSKGVSFLRKRSEQLA